MCPPLAFAPLLGPVHVPSCEIEYGHQWMRISRGPYPQRTQRDSFENGRTEFAPMGGDNRSEDMRAASTPAFARQQPSRYAPLVPTDPPIKEPPSRPQPQRNPPTRRPPNRRRQSVIRRLAALRR